MSRNDVNGLCGGVNDVSNALRRHHRDAMVAWGRWYKRASTNR